MKTTPIAEVVPLRSLPPQLTSFTYSIPQSLEKKISAGSIVTVPFKGHPIFGIVERVSAFKKTERKLETIEAVTDIVMTAAQRKLAAELSKIYLLSRASIYKSFLAPPPQKKRSISEQLPIIPTSKKGPSIKKIIDNGYVFYSNYSEVLSYCTQLAKSTQGQCVIIAPEIKHRSMLYNALRTAGLKQTLLLPAKQSKNAFYAAWKDSAEVSVVIGSMSALFLPFSTLKSIIVFEAENQLFKKAEQSPRYHLADFIDSVADIYKASVLFTGFSPDVVLLHQIQKKKLPVLRLGQSKSFSLLIDMKQERTSGNSGYISTQLADALTETIQPAVLIFNRLQDTQSLVCRICGYIATCQRCNRPLSIDHSKELLICLSCATPSAMYKQCPQCHSDHLGENGARTSVVLRELKKLLPDKNIIEISSKSRPINTLHSNDILVATNKIFSHFEYSFDVGAYINADQDLLLPNVYAAEMLRHHILKLSSMARRVFLQTSAPEHYLFSTLNDVRAFYDHELSTRATFHYPPTNRIIKITVSEKNESLYKTKLLEIKKRFSPITFFGPFEKRTPMRFTAVFIIKSALEDTTIDELLADSYNLFTVEINPFNFVS